MILERPPEIYDGTEKDKIYQRHCDTGKALQHYCNEQNTKDDPLENLALPKTRLPKKNNCGETQTQEDSLPSSKWRTHT